MKITKITDKYSFYKEGEGYTLNLGTIRKGEDTKVELLFEGFEDLNLKGGCSCVTKTKTDLEGATIVNFGIPRYRTPLLGPWNIPDSGYGS